jgi:hypothetical protein
MRIGKMVVPNFRLEFLLPALKKIDGTFKGEDGSKQDIADILEHEPKSGTLAQKIGDFKTYGLLEGRKDKLAVTELGKRAVSADESERNQAIQEAVKHVPLWSIFLSKYGTSIGKEHFAVTLRRDTGAEQSVAEKNAKFVRNAYLKDVSLIKSVGEPKTAPESGETADVTAVDRTWKMEAQSTDVKTASGYIWYPAYGRSPIEIKDDLSFAIAEKVLEAIKLDLKRRQKETARKDDELGKVESGQESENGESRDV